MRKEIPTPNAKRTIVISNANDHRAFRVMCLVLEKTDVRVSRAGVIAHLLSTMDVAKTAAEIAAKVTK